MELSAFAQAATELPCRDHAEERRWRHLDSCQFTTVIARQRSKCAKHGVKTVLVPWVEKSSRFTILLVSSAIDVLQAMQKVAGKSTLLQTCWDKTWYVLEKAIEPGNARKLNTPMAHRIGALCRFTKQAIR